MSLALQDAALQPVTDLFVVCCCGACSAPEDPLAAVNLWQSIRNLAFIKFNYNLPARVAPSVITPRAKLTLLRSLCRQTGITVAARDYDLSSANENPFTADDVLELFPIVKANVPKVPPPLLCVAFPALAHPLLYLLCCAVLCAVVSRKTRLICWTPAKRTWLRASFTWRIST
jgi:hypothetical protein